MKKRPWFVIASLATTLLIQPVGQAASSLDQINQQIAGLKQQQKDAAGKISQIDSKIHSIEVQKGDVQKDLEAIEQKLGDTQEKIKQLDSQIDTTTIRAQDAAAQLDKATKRVEERNGLLRTRVKAMYEIGDVSYLDVVLGAKNFGDFLDRVSAVNMIVSQDTKILEDNIKDKKTVEEKKKEVDGYLTSLKSYYAQATQLKNDLKQQEKERNNLMASLSKQQGELEDIKAEQQQEMLDLVEKMKTAQAEKYRLSGSGYSSPKVYSGGKFAWPIPDGGTITSGFGYRKDPFTGETAGHDGLDIGVPQGTTIVAAADGVVLVSGQVRGYGNCIIIDHGGNITTLYGHIRDGGLMVSEGQQVKRGQKIAEVGSTGRSTGPHLHFSVINGRTPVDPSGYLK
ncbi:MAG TPA: peptidoglycan DD-metalloendopeptidase family protein [Bacillota bacterium]|nr:peptidoglycan DD-metalloendopeptidase family protein [Bacillota bacterium]